MLASASTVQVVCAVLGVFLAVVGSVLGPWLRDRRKRLDELEDAVREVDAARGDGPRLRIAREKLPSKIDGWSHTMRDDENLRLLYRPATGNLALRIAAAGALERISRIRRRRHRRIVVGNVVYAGAVIAAVMGVVTQGSGGAGEIPASAARVGRPGNTPVTVAIAGDAPQRLWIGYRGLERDTRDDPVGLVEADDGEAVKMIPVGDRVTRVVAASDQVWALSCDRPYADGHCAQPRLSRIDPDARKVVSNIPFGKGTPSALAIIGNGSAVFAADGDRKVFQIVPKMAGQEVLRTVDGSGRAVHDLLATGESLWIGTDANNDSDVDSPQGILNGRTVRRLHIGPDGWATGAADVFYVGNGPHSLTQTPDGTVWVTNTCDGTVQPIASAGVGQAVPVGRDPTAIAASPRGDIWVVNEGEGTATALDPTTGKVIRRTVGDAPRALVVTPDDLVRVVGGGGDLWTLDPTASSRTRSSRSRGCPGLSGEGPGWPASYTGWFASGDGHVACNAADGTVSCSALTAGTGLSLAATGRPHAQPQTPQLPGAVSRMKRGENFITSEGSLFCGSRGRTLICRQLGADDNGWFIVVGPRGACVGRKGTGLAPIGTGAGTVDCPDGEGGGTPAWLTQAVTPLAASGAGQSAPLPPDTEVHVCADAADPTVLRLLDEGGTKDMTVPVNAVESYGVPVACATSVGG